MAPFARGAAAMQLAIVVVGLGSVAAQEQSPPLCPTGFFRASSVLFDCKPENEEVTGEVGLLVPPLTTLAAVHIPEGMVSFSLTAEGRGKGVQLGVSSGDSRSSLYGTSTLRGRPAIKGRPAIRTFVTSTAPYQAKVIINGSSTEDLAVRIRNPASDAINVSMTYAYKGSPVECHSVPIGCLVYNQSETMLIMAQWSAWLQQAFPDAEWAWSHWSTLTGDVNDAEQKVPWNAWAVVWERWGFHVHHWMAAFHFIDGLGVEDYYVSKDEFLLAFRFKDVYPSIQAFTRMIATYPTLDDSWSALTGNSGAVSALDGISLERFEIIWDAFHPSDKSDGLLSATEVFKYLSYKKVLRKGVFTQLYRSATTLTSGPLVTTVKTDAKHPSTHTTHTTQHCADDAEAGCDSEDGLGVLWVGILLALIIVGVILWRCGVCPELDAKEHSQMRGTQSRDVVSKKVSTNYNPVEKKSEHHHHEQQDGHQPGLEDRHPLIEEASAPIIEESPREPLPPPPRESAFHEMITAPSQPAGEIGSMKTNAPHGAPFIPPEPHHAHGHPAEEVHRARGGCSSCFRKPKVLESPAGSRDH